MPDVSTAASNDAPSTVAGMIDSVIDVPAETGEAAEPETAEAPPELETPETEPETETEPEAAPESEAEGQPAEQPQTEAEPEVDATDELKPDKVSADGKMHFYTRARSLTLQADHKFANDIRAVIPNASIEMLKENYGRVVELDVTLANLDSGDAERVAQAAAELFPEGGNPESMGMFADHLMRTAAEKHPAIYDHIAKKVIGGYTQSLYDKAFQTGDDSLWALAANLDFKQRGKFIKKEEFQQRDPYAERAADLERRERAYSERVQRDRQTFVESQMAAIKSAEDAAVNEDIEKALEPVAKAFKSTPHWKHMTRDIRDAIEEARRANPTWQRQYALQEQKVRSNPTEESKAALVTMMRQFAAPVIAKNKKAVIEAHTQTVMGKAADAHKKQQQIAERREPVGGNPVQRATLAQKVRDAKTQAEVWSSIGL